MAATPNFCLSAGTYERVLFGYDFQVPEKIPATPTQLPSRYMCAPHFGCIKAVASHSKGILLSGSTDGSFKYAFLLITLFSQSSLDLSNRLFRAYNLKRNVQIDSLTHHKGTVAIFENQLYFF